MIAIGVVFVLLLGEIDLSIGYVSGVAGVTVAELQLPGSGHQLPGLVAIAARGPRRRADRRVPGLVRRLHRRPVVRRHARRPARLAGRDPALARPQGVIVIQDNTINDIANYFFSPTAGLDHRRRSSSVVLRSAWSCLRYLGKRRHGIADRTTSWLAIVKVVVVTAVACFVVVQVQHRSRARRAVRRAAHGRRCSSSGRSSRTGRRSAATSTPSAATPRRRAAPAST